MAGKQLRFVVAPGPTIASTTYASLLPPPHECEDGEWCEVCPEGLVMVKEMARRIRESGGGAALIADYGQDGVRKNTLRVSYHIIVYYFGSVFYQQTILW